MSNIEQVLPKLISSLKSSYGRDFFDEITLQFNKIIGADYTFIAQIDNDKGIAKTVSLAAKGELAANFEYNLKDTPCALVIDDSVCIYPKKICSYFPKDQLLIDMNIEGYTGTALHDSHGNVKGIIVALHEQEIENPNFAITLFELFSGRIAAEIERSEQNKRLEELNIKLTSKVNALTASENRLSIHLQNTPLGCIEWDRNFHCTEWNKAAEKLFGYSAAEAIGRHAAEIILPHDIKDNIGDIYKLLLEQTGGIRSTNENITKNGNIIKCDWYNTPIISEDGTVTGVASLIEDITEKEQQEELLRRTQKLDALGELTGGIAHDQNNMLNVILGYADLLESKLQEQPHLLKNIHKIQYAGNRSAKLISKLLAFAKTIPTSPSQININTLLLKEQDMLQKMLTVKVELKLILADDLWSVWLDSHDLCDAMLNLCINSMHALHNKTHDEQVIISSHNVNVGNVEAKSIGVNAGQYILICITDNGCGIEKSVQEKMFDPFFSTKKDKGTGLGLSQVFSFVKRSGGIIKVDSKVGLGSTFMLYFPRYQNHNATTNNARVLEENNFSGKETILVVDDEIFLSELCSELLTIQGYKVFCANGHKQAFEVLENESVDLMISDVLMPEMNGYQLSSIVQEKYPSIKIQLVSGFTDNKEIEHLDNTLHKNMIGKPYNAKTLYKKIRELLDSKINN